MVKEPSTTDDLSSLAKNLIFARLLVLSAAFIVIKAQCRKSSDSSSSGVNTALPDSSSSKNVRARSTLISLSFATKAASIPARGGGRINVTKPLINGLFSYSCANLSITLIGGVPGAPYLICKSQLHPLSLRRLASRPLSSSAPLSPMLVYPSCRYRKRLPGLYRSSGER